MYAYDATCPVCGYRNTSMYLEETDGWMECKSCRQLHQFRHFRREKAAMLYGAGRVSKRILPVKAGC